MTWRATGSTERAAPLGSGQVAVQTPQGRPEHRPPLEPPSHDEAANPVEATASRHCRAAATTVSRCPCPPVEPAGTASADPDLGMAPQPGQLRLGEGPPAAPAGLSGLTVSQGGHP